MMTKARKIVTGCREATEADVAAWAAAIDALAKPDGDPKPLAALFRSGEVPPPKILALVAQLLDPDGFPFFDVKLAPQEIKNGSWSKHITKKSRQIRICFDVKRWLEAGKTVGEAKVAVAEQLHLTLDTVSKEWEVGQKQLTPLFNRFGLKGRFGKNKPRKSP